MIGEKKIGIADDRRQNIIEIMRDPACKLTYRLHLLGLREIFFESAQFRGVEGIDRSTRAIGFVGGGNEKAGGAFALTAQADVDGRYIAL